jgi:hypothetical protein
MERFDLECLCGHSKETHYGKWHYAMARYRGSCSFMGCFCFLYKPDNLKYLEMLSKEKEVADL